MTMVMTISKAKLKAQLLEVLRRLESEGGEVIVTDHGKPAIRMTPLSGSVRDVFLVSESAGVYGLESLDEPTADEWEVS
jgi:prevent-host-death family protein